MPGLTQAAARRLRLRYPASATLADLVRSLLTLTTCVWFSLLLCGCSSERSGDLTTQRMIEEAIDLEKRGRALEDLSGSIPEIHFRYLDRVNTSNEAIHFLPNDSMRRASAMIAAWALNESYVPRDFLRSTAQAALIARKFPSELIDSVFLRR